VRTHAEVPWYFPDTIRPLWRLGDTTRHPGPAGQIP
jgi:hypothetical protein